jgi:hypothetical protein
MQIVELAQSTSEKQNIFGKRLAAAPDTCLHHDILRDA